MIIRLLYIIIYQLVCTSISDELYLLTKEGIGEYMEEGGWQCEQTDQVIQKEEGGGHRGPNASEGARPSAQLPDRLQ